MPSVRSIKMAYPYYSPPPPQHPCNPHPTPTPPFRNGAPPPHHSTSPSKAPSSSPKTSFIPPKSHAYPPLAPKKPNAPSKPSAPHYPPCYSIPPYNHYPSIAPSPYSPYSPPPNTIVPRIPSGEGGHNHIIIICASLGGIFLLALVAIGVFCLTKKKKKPIMAAMCVLEPIGTHQHAVITSEHDYGGGEISGARSDMPMSRGY